MTGCQHHRVGESLVRYQVGEYPSIYQVVESPVRYQVGESPNIIKLWKLRELSSRGIPVNYQVVESSVETGQLKMPERHQGWR